jgi:hypothetical protein
MFNDKRYLPVRDQNKTILMAKPTLKIIHDLRSAATKLAGSQHYQWGHMGACNCGFLAQEVTKLKAAEIHRRALLGHGDWTEQLNDYCAVSGLPFDDVISDLLNAGFSTRDLRHLERLSDPAVLQMLPLHRRALHHNIKTDAVIYLIAWATLLENRLLSKITLAELAIEEVAQ